MIKPGKMLRFVIEYEGPDELSFGIDSSIQDVKAEIPDTEDITAALRALVDFIEETGDVPMAILYNRKDIYGDPDENEANAQPVEVHDKNGNVLN